MSGAKSYTLQMAFDSSYSLKAALAAVELSQYDNYTIMEPEDVHIVVLSLWNGCFPSKGRPPIMPGSFEKDTWDQEARDWRKIAELLRESADNINEFIDKLETSKG